MARLGLSGDCEVELLVDEGIVEMMGTVPTFARKAEILEAISRVPGITDIETDIHVLREGDSTAPEFETNPEEIHSGQQAEELMEEDYRFFSGEEESFQ